MYIYIYENSTKHTATLLEMVINTIDLYHDIDT